VQRQTDGMTSGNDTGTDEVVGGRETDGEQSGSRPRAAGAVDGRRLGGREADGGESCRVAMAASNEIAAAGR